MTITADQVTSKLLTLDEVHHALEQTEPLDSKLFSSENAVSFKMGQTWNQDIDDLYGREPVDVYMTIDGTERQLSKDAVLQTTANVGLTGAYVKKTPASLIESQLNYWYSSAGIGQSAFSILQVKDTVQALTKSNHVPFSNITLLEVVTEAIKDYYGHNTTILADYKFQHSLLHTDIRLVIPGEDRERTIYNTGVHDDQWSAGVHVSNSLTGKSMTSVESYLFRWWCTNGATTEFDGAGNWNRRLNGQEEVDVWDWARHSVNDILGGMESRFDEVQALTSVDVNQNISEVTQEVFETYKIPGRYRGLVTDALIKDPGEGLTMYSIMQAVTQVANQQDISWQHADRMMRVGGNIPTAHFSPLKAKVFAEGQANPKGPNPYAIPSAN
jgi:hypothetical protein